MAKAGGRSFKKWCFKIEGIHPETGRRRKNRALAKISASFVRSDIQHSETGRSPLLHSGQEIGHISDTVEEGAGKRDGLNSWAADDAFTSFLSDTPADFSWARKRWERRRQREAKKRKQEEAA